MKRFEILLIVAVSIIIGCAYPYPLFADTRFGEGDAGLISLDHWSVEAVTYLYEYGLCENPVKFAASIDKDKEAISEDRIVKLTVQAYLRAKLATINGESVPAGAWLCLEGLAAQYADEIDDNRRFPKEIVFTSRSMIHQSIYIREYKKFYEVPKDNWVYVGLDLFFIQPTPHKYYLEETVGRSTTEFELAMMVYQTIDTEMKSTGASARPEPGMLVVCESMLGDLEQALNDLELDVPGMNDWLRSQPEYPRDLIEGT